MKTLSLTLSLEGEGICNRDMQGVEGVFTNCLATISMLTDPTVPAMLRG
jgi:hypothetical protein